jgi:hypothetical protein
MPGMRACGDEQVPARARGRDPLSFSRVHQVHEVVAGCVRYRSRSDGVARMSGVLLFWRNGRAVDGSRTDRRPATPIARSCAAAAGAFAGLATLTTPMERRLVLEVSVLWAQAGGYFAESTFSASAAPSRACPQRCSLPLSQLRRAGVVDGGVRRRFAYAPYWGLVAGVFTSMFSLAARAAARAAVSWPRMVGNYARRAIP